MKIKHSLKYLTAIIFLFIFAGFASNAKASQTNIETEESSLLKTKAIETKVIDGFYQRC